MERIPVVASNTVDDNPCPPTDYTYMTASKLSPDIPKRKPAKGCGCKGVCTDTEKCSCARLNGNVIPYVHNHGGRYDSEQPEMIQYLVSCVVWVICFDLSSSGQCAFLRDYPIWF
jgi:euchromatic histone-lysine N-methyltransferase